MNDFSEKEIAYLLATAGRAPSLHNSQPWRFRPAGHMIELHADPARKLRRVDPDGREMLISCGAALYGLRLGLRKLGYRPEVALLPDPARPGLLARAWPGGRAPVTGEETDLLAALPHRHTHRGPFVPGPLSPHLLAAIHQDAVCEGARLEEVSQPDQLRALAALVVAAGHAQQADAEITAELSRWTRPAGTDARDGIPAHAWASPPAELPARAYRPGQSPPDQPPGRLPARNFGWPGSLLPGGPSLPVTAVLTTAGDTPADWLRAGQGLNRLLLRAAGHWVFASLQSQPVESPAIRADLREQLALQGVPQLVLQFGRANTAASTARRPSRELLDPA